LITRIFNCTGPRPDDASEGLAADGAQVLHRAQRSAGMVCLRPADTWGTDLELLERDACLADLAAWSKDLARGGCIVLLGAEAGLGKTSLAREFVDRQPGTRVLWGACDELFTPRPLAPLLDIARQTGGPLLDAVRARSDRDGLFTAALDEFERQPTIAVFEDLHWADEATLDFLKFVGRRIGQTRCMLVVTYRDDEVRLGHPLYFVLGDLPRRQTHRLTLAPLSEAAVARLAKPTARSAREVHRITGGNPLFVTEVLSSDGSEVPGTIREAVLARAAQLPEGARRIASLVSVVPTAAEAWLVDALLAPGSADVDACLYLGMQRRADGALAFRHELVRRAFEASLPPLQRRDWHSAILRVLADRADVPPARLAHHAAGAEDGAAVLQHAQAAAKQAAVVGAHREAAAHYAAALAHAGPLDARQRAELHEALAYEHYLTDHIDQSLEARRAALSLWDSVGDRLRRGDNLRWLSRLSWFAGQRVSAEEFAAAAIATLEPLPPGRELALAYSNFAQLEMLAHHCPSAVAWATRALEIAERLEDVEVQVHALNNRGTARMLDGHLDGEGDLERSLRTALAHNLQEHVARAYTNVASTSVALHRYAVASRFLEEGMAYTENHDLDSWRLYMQAWRARLRLEQGDWLGAGDDAEAVVGNPRTSAVARLPALVVLGLLRVRRGDPDASTPLDEARALAESAREIQRTAPLVVALAERAALADDLSSMVDTLQQALPLAVERGDPFIRGSIATWLWRAGALAELPTGAAEPYEHEWAGRWRDAATGWGTLGCPYERAWVLAHYGDENAQREALAAFEALGATPAAQQLRRRMRARGVRKVPRGSRVSTRSNAFGLTKREAQILDLMRAGLRNSAIARKLFLSTRTVDHHVSAVLAKLGAKTRAEAVAKAGSSTDDTG
jgi:DNA-binding CsgD family transcriptional regulator